MNDQQAEEQQERARRIQEAETEQSKAADKKRWGQVELAKKKATSKADKEYNALVTKYLREALADAADVYWYVLDDSVVEVGMSNEYYPYSRADRLSTRLSGNVSIVDATGSTIYTSDKWRR